MNHREKLRLARRNMSQWETQRKGPGSSPFKSGWWENRALAIRIRVARKQQPELIRKLGL